MSIRHKKRLTQSIVKYADYAAERQVLLDALRQIVRQWIHDGACYDESCNCESSLLLIEARALLAEREPEA